MNDNKLLLKKNDNLETMCFFEINSGDEITIRNQLSNANIQDISKFQEKEIVFFPFTCFEINSVKKKKLKDFLDYEIVKNNISISNKIQLLIGKDFNEIYYEIKLNYLGKYSEQIKKIKDKITLTNFAKNIFHTEIFNKEELEIKDSDKFAFDISQFIKKKVKDSEKFASEISQIIKKVYYIIGYYKITNKDANKNIFIINCSEKNIDKIQNCEIYLLNKKIKFTKEYKFNKGEYNIKFYFKNDFSNLNNLFKNCSTLYKIDFSNFKINNITEMSYMFFECNSLIEINLNDFKTQNVTNMSYLFHKCCSLKKLNLSQLNTENVTNMNHMFSDCSSLTQLNLSNFNTQKVNDMNSMFFQCSSLIELNLSNFDTKNVINMRWMFSKCSSLKKLKISSFRTNNVTDMSYMFNECSSLLKLNLSKFSTINVNDMSLKDVVK